MTDSHSSTAVITGVDPSGDRLDCAVLTDPQAGRVTLKSLPKTANGARQLVQWIQRQGYGGTHVVMEAAAVYHQAVATAFHDSGACVSLVDPTDLASFQQRAREKVSEQLKPSVLLAFYGHLANPPAWTPPDPSVAEFQLLLEELDRLEEAIQREETRLEEVQTLQPRGPVVDGVRNVLRVMREEKARLNRELEEGIGSS
jgi:transposase